MINKFRKKPIVDEAVQWTGENTVDICNFLGLKNLRTDLLLESKLIIKTLEGNIIASISDWIIKGIKGEFYPCKPDIFAETYEKVE